MADVGRGGVWGSEIVDCRLRIGDVDSRLRGNDGGGAVMTAVGAGVTGGVCGSDGRCVRE